MWLEEYKPGKHRVRWRITGKKTPAAGPTFPTAALAQSWADANALTVKRELRLAEVIDLWRDQLPSDYRKNVADILGQLALTRGWLKVKDISPAAIALWQREAGEARRDKVSGKKAKGVHVSRYMQYLLTILRWSARTYKIEVDPDVLSLRPPKLERKANKELLTEEQVASIREASWAYGPRAAALIDYLLTYGARPVTACKLTLGDLRGSVLTIDKAKHSGGWSHPIDAEQAAEWKRHNYSNESSAPLFPHPSEDRPWRVTGGRAKEVCDWYLHTISNKLKLPKNVHGIYDLKRWAITRMLDAGLPPADIAMFTGHRNLEQILTYNRTNETRAQKALEILRKPAITFKPNDQ